jgi:hypothetical protein
MAGASEFRGSRVFAGLVVSLAALFALLAFSAQPAQAETRVIKGGETGMRVNVWNFVKMVGDGMWAYEVKPARIQYGSRPTMFFPIRGVGVVDPALPLTTISHDGGLRIVKPSVGQELQVWNITATCAPVAGCRLLATANGALPTEFAELHDPQITDDGNGTVTLTGSARLGTASALALNVLFQTAIFTPGFELGIWTSTVKY